MLFPYASAELKLVLFAVILYFSIIWSSSFPAVMKLSTGATLDI